MSYTKNGYAFIKFVGRKAQYLNAICAAICVGLAEQLDSAYISFKDGAASVWRTKHAAAFVGMTFKATALRINISARCFRHNMPVDGCFVFWGLRHWQVDFFLP